jgi:hypothetical protein
MVQGQDDPRDGDEGRVLSPDELDITDDEHVAEIDDGRYVVSPNDPISDVPGQHPVGNGPDSGDNSQDAPALGGQSPRESTDSAGPDVSTREHADRRKTPPSVGHVTEAAVRDWLVDQFEGTNSRYGFDVTGKFDGSVQHRQMVSNDVVTIFESLVLWYAQQIDSTTPVEEVLGILLMEANVPIRYPAAGLQHLVESSDLGPDDTIADLVEAVGEDGFRL